MKKRRLSTSILALLLCFLLSFSNSLIAQEKPKKIGLVLSGGGAKGLAHIGVLKIIDSLDIPIDYVAGTSMGAIIGGLYASGYSGKQLDSIFKNTNFPSVMTDQLNRSLLNVTERDDSEKYALSLPFDNFQIKLPSALSKGQNFYDLLSRLLYHVRDVNNFSELPIPFFCIVTNAETGAEVLFDKGYLPKVVTASGSIPSVFSPVEIDGSLYIDGGVTNNYPIDEIKARGAEIVIGVDVQDSLFPKEMLDNALSLLIQVNNFRTIKDMKRKRPLTDIYIRPDITNFSVVDFQSGEEIIQRGDVAGKEKIPELLKLSRPEDLRRNEVIYFDLKEPIQLDALEVTGNNAYSRSYIRGKLQVNPPQQTNFKNIIAGVKNLQATSNFDRIDYRIVQNDNKTTLKVDVKETKTRSLLRFGLHYDDLYKSAALVNYTRKRNLTRNDFFSLDLILGDNFRYNMDYIIDRGNYFSAGISSRRKKFDRSVPGEFIESVIGSSFDGINRLNVEYEDITNRLYVKGILQKSIGLTVGIEHKYLHIFSETIRNTPENSISDFENTDYGSFFGDLIYDSYDNTYFPTKGMLFKGFFQGFLTSSDFRGDFRDFYVAHATLGYAFKFSERWSTRLELSGGFQVNANPNSPLDFF
ncbi:MAG: patatin-like phospholipase family protein, partial [Flavobacteriaceae bacterium]|nr:patatin-like phospholipase family protein [Flavobacteriaceae bacterium]